MQNVHNSQYLPTRVELRTIVPIPTDIVMEISTEKEVREDRYCRSSMTVMFEPREDKSSDSSTTGGNTVRIGSGSPLVPQEDTEPDNPQDDEIHSPMSGSSIDVFIHSFESLRTPTALKALMDYSRVEGHSVDDVALGDGGFIAIGDGSISLIFQYGAHQVTVLGESEALSRAHATSIGQIIEAKFQTKIFLLRPIQTLDDASIPLISGKKMGVFVGIEIGSSLLESKEYSLRLQGKGGQFRQNDYHIQISDKKWEQFGEELEDVKDGATWKKEEVKLLDEEEAKDCLERFAVRDKPREGFVRRVYRFMLAPPIPNFNGICQFRASIIDGDEKILSQQLVSPRTVPSPRKRIAIIPLRIGYWAPPQYWLGIIKEHGIESLTNFKRLRRKNSTITRGPSLAWKAKEQIRKSFLSTVTGDHVPLPSEAERDTWSKLLPTSRIQVEKAARNGTGKQAYLELAKEVVRYTKAVFPTAEQCLEFTIEEDQPFCVSDPNPSTWKNSRAKTDPLRVLQMAALPPDAKIDLRELILAVDGVRNKLVEFLHDHPQYDRVLAIIPGGEPGDGGVNLDIGGHSLRMLRLVSAVAGEGGDESYLGLNLPDRGTIMADILSLGQTCPERRTSLLVLDPATRYLYAPRLVETGAHELAHSFEAVDEYLGLGKVQKFMTKNPIPQALEIDNVSGGFWAARQEFQGSAKQPAYSLMTVTKGDQRNRRWISPELYKGLIDRLSR